MKKIKNEKAITLISLIITVIILLILAGVTLTLTLGNNGIFNTTKDSKIQTEIADIKEQIQTDIIEEQAGNKGRISNKSLKTILEKYGTINYEEDETTIKSITTTKGNYEIAMADIWNGTTVAELSVGDLFDETGTEEGKLHIGDFINYTAGTWTNADMTEIAKTGVTPNNSTSLPSKHYKFGGFTVGGSRDGNATPYSTSYAYVQDKEAGNAVTGWRLFDVSDDGVMTLISAGCPEDYCHMYDAILSEYILTGKTRNYNSGNIPSYKPRSWGMYVNKDYGATGASVLTKAKLDAWYTKYTNTANADTVTAETFQKIYKTDTNCVNNGKYESLIDNYSYYWLSERGSGGDVSYVDPLSRYVGSDYKTAFGIRVLVSISSNVKLSERAVDTKTVINRGNEYTYNVWNLVAK